MSFSTGRCSGFSAGTAVAATSTVTGGCAQSDAQGVANKMSGFNLKYRYEQDDNPLGANRFLHLPEKIVLTVRAITTKVSTTASLPARKHRLNDWASIYGVVGVGYGKFQTTDYPTYKHDTSDYGFSWRWSAIQPDGKCCSGLLLRAEPYS